MTHENVIERLDDWAGGELSVAERAEVDLHLAGCAECRAEAEGLRTLLAEIEALPTQVMPQRELWSGIAGRLEPRGEGAATPGRAGGAVARFPRWALQAAAALTLAVGSSALTYWYVGPREISREIGRVADGFQTPKPTVTALAAFHPAEREYQTAIAELEMALQTQRGKLAPETVQTLEANLAIIDEAIRQSREALARDPNSAQLTRMLAEAYDQKLGVLQQAVAL